MPADCHASVLCGLANSLCVWVLLRNAPAGRDDFGCNSAVALICHGQDLPHRWFCGFGIFGKRLRLSSKMVIALSGLAAMLAVAAIVLFGSIYFRDYPPFSYARCFDDWKLYLWEGAWSAFLDRFPNGRCWSVRCVYEIPIVANIVYGNTFLGLLVEFGALGVLLAGLFYLIARSIRHWPSHIMLIVLALLHFSDDVP